MGNQCQTKGDIVDNTEEQPVIARDVGAADTSTESSLKTQEAPLEASTDAQSSERLSRPFRDENGRRTARRNHRSLYLTDTMGVVPSSAWKININNPGRIEDFYTVQQSLGKGAFGVVTLAQLQATQEIRALKSILKEPMREHAGALKDEIDSMKKLDHPYVVLLYEIFETSDTITLALEPCHGGDLEAYVNLRGCLDEEQVTTTLQQVLRAVCYLHSNHICHRDLKSENLLLANKDRLGVHSINCIKVADFGMACICKPGQFLSQPVGTSSHMAPEIYAKKYNISADMFAVGVITFYLVCADLPFDALKKEKEGRWKVSYGSKNWAQFSNDGEIVVNFVMSLLSKEEKKRPTATAALRDAFIVENVPRPLHEPVTQSTMSRLVRFRSSHPLKRAALCVVASLLTDMQTTSSRRLFNSLDLAGDGLIDLPQTLSRMQASHKSATEMLGSLQNKLKMFDYDNAGTKDTLDDKQKRARAAKLKKDKATLEKKVTAAEKLQADLQREVNEFVTVSKALDAETSRALFEQSGQGKTGGSQAFTYLEFIAATFPRTRDLPENVCRAAFAAFDRKGLGYLPLADLANGKLLGTLREGEAEATLKGLDKEADQVIDFEEFKAMLQDETLESAGDAEEGSKEKRGVKSKKATTKHTPGQLPSSKKSNPRVTMQTSMGNITFELFQNEMPIAASNFVALVKDSFYKGTHFHRVRKDFLQGGCPNSTDPDSEKVGFGHAPPNTTFKNLKYDNEFETRGRTGTITDEFGFNKKGEFRLMSKISNFAGTIALANDSGLENSCSSQFCINVEDNFELDWWHPKNRSRSYHPKDSPQHAGQNWGNPVIGRILEGMDIAKDLSEMRADDPEDEKGDSPIKIEGLRMAGASTAAAVSAQDTAKPRVTIETSFGPLTFELFLFEMPITVSNFLFLAKDHYYDGTHFHRVREDCVQGGCPFSSDLEGANVGSGNAPPYSTFKNLKYDDEVETRDSDGNIKDEFGYNKLGEFRLTSKISNKAGTIAMANTGLENTGSCQFFINVTNNPELDWWHSKNRKKSYHPKDSPEKAGQNWGHPVFGKLVDGMEVLKKIAENRSDDPMNERGKSPIQITKVTIPKSTLMKLGEPKLLRPHLTTFGPART